MTPADRCRSSSQAKWTRRPLLAACAALLLLTGCGGGMGFDGGTFPPGKAALLGRVVAAENALSPLPDTRIAVRATFSTTTRAVGTVQTQSLSAVTDEFGNFSIPNIPTGVYTGMVSVTVTSRDPRRITQQLTFQLANGHGSNLIVALPDNLNSVQRASRVTIEPTTIALVPGQKATFRAEVLNSAGSALPVSPTLLFGDDFGTLNSDGTFVGTGTGTGTLSALWYSASPAYANVIVNPTMPIQPPGPPAGTGTGPVTPVGKESGP